MKKMASSSAGNSLREHKVAVPTNTYIKKLYHPTTVNPANPSNGI